MAVGRNLCDSDWKVIFAPPTILSTQDEIRIWELKNGTTRKEFQLRGNCFIRITYLFVNMFISEVVFLEWFLCWLVLCLFSVDQEPTIHLNGSFSPSYTQMSLVFLSTHSDSYDNVFVIMSLYTTTPSCTLWTCRLRMLERPICQAISHFNVDM